MEKTAIMEKLYYEDLENRYNIRKEKVYSKTKELMKIK